jgi:hypothetical protein
MSTTIFEPETEPSGATISVPVTASVLPTASFGKSTPTSCSWTLYLARASKISSLAGFPVSNVGSGGGAAGAPCPGAAVPRRRRQHAGTGDNSCEQTDQYMRFQCVLLVAILVRARDSRSADTSIRSAALQGGGNSGRGMRPPNPILLARKSTIPGSCQSPVARDGIEHGTSCDVREAKEGGR